MEKLKINRFFIPMFLCFIMLGTFLFLGNVVQASSVNEEVIEPKKMGQIKPEIVLKEIPEGIEKWYYNLASQEDISEAELLKELEKRIKDALLSENEIVEILDLQIDNIMMNTLCKSIPYISKGIKAQGYRYQDIPYISFIKIETTMTVEEIKKHILAVDQKVTEILSQVNDTMSDEMKALIIHDYFIYEYAYDYDNYLAGTIPDDSYTSGGIFLNKTGVCNAYACGYYYIMNRLGIECYVTSSEEINHAWNIINIDGSYYHVDCTWDDPVYDKIGMVGHYYFLLSDTAIQKSHTGWDSNLICNNEKYDEIYWREISSKIIFNKDKIYYIEEKERAIYSQDIVSGVKNKIRDLGKWYVLGDEEKEGWFYTFSYSGLFYENGELYYNTAEEIRKISLDGEVDTLIYKPNTTDGYVYGSKKSGTDLEYVIKQSPSDSAKKEVREKISNQFTIEVIDILLADKEIQLNIDESFILTYGIVPQDAISKVIWKSSDESVVSVSDQGVIIALKEGYAIITVVTEDGNKEAFCKVIVEQDKGKLGDVDNSGDIDVNDALIILKISASLITPTQAQEKTADVNGDNTIDSADALLVLKYAAGLITEFSNS